MKLLHLHLHDRYRSLPAGFRVEFLQEAEKPRCFEFAPFCLAGLNGSGKSNLLEALAAIFYHIEVMHLTFRPDNFTAEENPDGFDSRKGEPDAYELEYYCQDDNLRNTWDNFRWDDTSWDEQPVVHIRLTKKVGTAPVMQWLNRHEFDAENKPLELTSLEAKRYLPRYILGYSSGHNEVLSLPFRKMRCIHFDEYRHYLRKSLPYSKPEGRMLFMDESYSQVILLCHFLFPSSAVQQVFLKKVGLVGIRRFRFVIRRAEKVKSEAGEIELTSRLSGKQDAEGKLQARLLDKLIQCATCHYEDYRYEADEDAYDLYLDYLMDEAGEMRKAFRYHFGEGAENASEELVMAKSALNLFEALHVLLTLNGYQTSDEVKKDLYESHSLYSAETLPTPASHDRIFRIKDFELVKKGVNGQLYGKALSDGEHQLLHTSASACSSAMNPLYSSWMSRKRI
ncbi:restriction system-associated AAA family ATPase [Prosthecobacter debontii]|uniref:Restriction system-associated AAA family ATPase n=1 Tax=Prosthecobacter debontii TaxID=48467 RepID=A0A1T4Z1M4_9BACT|nr:restriction system-associated AAA family ATPase [Prosthecobacter debontii]SKB07934.1 restriction system-associated AAA family ATPase [Prosthecobacter debontii]